MRTPKSDDQEKRAFTISPGPVTSPSPRLENVEDDSTALPMHYGAPLLLAIARDPQTLFACWSVDWPAAFAKGQPADRTAHLQVKTPDGAISQSVAVEPMRGTCAIPNLKSGEAYSLELGYYAPEDHWHRVAVSEDVTMPSEIASADAIDVATVPFHLTFERMLEMFRNAPANELVETLADFQEAAGTEMTLDDNQRDVLSAMNISQENLREVASYRQTLRAAEKIRESTLETFGGFSSGSGFGGSSQS